VPAAKAGFFPLDEQLELGEQVWSVGVEREAARLSAVVPSFDEAAELLQRLGQINLSTTSVWRCAQAVGAKFRRQEAAERTAANALPAAGSHPVVRSERPPRLGAAMDGTMIHIRTEGWKDLKVGVIFEVATQLTPDPVTSALVPLAHAVANSYKAHLGGPVVLGALTWAEAHRRGWEQAPATVVIGDGAPWIWQQADLHFAGSVQVIDWYHAKQQLLAAARLCHPEGSSAFHRWVKRTETLLYQGHAAQLAHELDTLAAQIPAHADELRRSAGYFRTNQRRMNYLELREDEWPIGSGMVESGAKQFKTRFAGPGMRWSRNGAQNLIPLRAALLSHRFDHLWSLAQNLPPN
jgi:hypothetical protein